MSTPALITLFTFSPNIALAAEESSSLLPPIWPLIALFVIVIVFRKQLNCNPSIEQQNSPPPAEPSPTESPSQTPAEQPSQPEPAPTNAPVQTSPEQLTPTPKPKPEPEPEPKNIEVETLANTIIDIKDGGKRCQASTTKGTRCRRKTTLEDNSVTIDGTTYLLTVCKQHSISNFKPFAELIK